MSKKRRKARKRRKQARENAKKFLLWLLVILIIFAALVVVNERWIHCEYIPTSTDILKFFDLDKRPDITVQQDEISVHFIDVGQGDSILIDTPDKDILIDCGETEYASRVIMYIRSFGITKLDYVMASHQHSDHMGGMSRILTAFDVDEFIMPVIPDDMIPTLDFYTEAMSVIDEKDITLTYSEIGSTIQLCEGTSLNIIGPIGTGYSDLNSYSIIAKLISGNRSFLFTGDTEKDAEFVMSGSWLTDLSADVLKVPHHGSTSSSSAEFVLRVQPEYAVFTAGSDNKYGHPNGEIVAFYRSIGSEVLMTMNCGDIVFVTDGNEIRYATASGQKGAA